MMFLGMQYLFWEVSLCIFEICIRCVIFISCNCCLCFVTMGGAYCITYCAARTCLGPTQSGPNYGIKPARGRNRKEVYKKNSFCQIEVRPVTCACTVLSGEASYRRRDTSNLRQMEYSNVWNDDIYRLFLSPPSCRVQILLDAPLVTCLVPGPRQLALRTPLLPHV